ncbi:hypothetical protein CRU98_05885 [Arcobacter sp. CECT 8986]|uniref:sensor domain-containing diguanylate cyclase n=1 Tax=Arcobacter sp. CECT 8986 TaxID=2044507 RepID=UPI001009DD59|nr:GGDEF domain-containing protein [Arcobacter sp. CECT 8986]RXJ99556.1 hypothetical protein CRU98_05885 [Arcobacter sp. CECT 8986]
MKISTKISIFFISICVVLSFCIFFVLEKSNKKTIEFENTQVNKSIKIFFDALYTKVDFLNEIAYEYSTNDKLINLIVSNKIKSYKKDFIKDRYSHFILFDKNKNFLYGNVYDISSDEFISAPSKLNDFIKNNNINMYINKTNRVNLITLDYEKVLFTIKQIKKDNKIVGYIFIGRTLDSSFLSSLSKISHNYISYIPTYKLLEDKKRVKIESQNYIYDINRVNESEIFTHIKFKDEINNSDFFISMKINRDYFIQINDNNSTIFYILIFTFILVIVVIYLFINKIFSKRITTLINHINNVSNLNTLQLEIELKYNDELTFLGKKIDEMLKSINTKQHEKLKKERDFLQSVLDTQKDIILITDGKDIESANKKFIDLFKTKEHFLTNIALIDDSIQSSLINFAKKYESYENPVKLKIENSDRYFIFDVRKIDMKKYLICMNDVSKYNEKIYTLEQKAMTDELTTAYNKSAITSILKYWLQMQDFCLIIFDIDYFKNINDTYGHYIGDCILKDLTKVIKSSLHKDDILGRFGGEEFIILLDDRSDNNIENIANRIRKKIMSSTFNYEELHINITISLGVTFCKKDESFEDVYKRVDEALYQAKKEGRNRVCLI